MGELRPRVAPRERPQGEALARAPDPRHTKEEQRIPQRELEAYAGVPWANPRDAGAPHVTLAENSCQSCSKRTRRRIQAVALFLNQAIDVCVVGRRRRRKTSTTSVARRR